ncbi:MAG: YggS family pyridoxal phosphate-dependent enzyme [Elusimicrobiaceae bacterium]|nr:YggS family pyridoxal phosphate-dependent enzyme [Elusimicrobiaceae bacterium]
MYREEILLQNWRDVKSSLSAACERSRRMPDEVTLLAVTKYAKDSDVLFLLSQGLLTDIAESRVQQAWSRWKENPDFAKFTAVKKHFIGHLQKNKAAKAALLFDWIDSLDDFETARTLSTHLPQGKTLRALVQVKLTDKDTQSGLPLTQARELARQLNGAFDNLTVHGYMAVAPQGAEEPKLRELFRQVAQAFLEDFKDISDAQLSLGMSEDFITAVEAGSTLPRIGSLLFNRNLEEL